MKIYKYSKNCFYSKIGYMFKILS